MFIGSVYALYDYPTLQLILFMWINLITTMYQGYFKPLLNNFDNQLNLFNEFMVSSMAYTSVIFSEMAKSEEEKYFFGWVLIFLISSTFMINMVIVLLITIKKVFLIILKCYNYGKYLKDEIVNSEFMTNIFVKLESLSPSSQL